MGNYATLTADVLPLVPYRTLSASTQPTDTQANTWIASAEAELDGVLSAQGISVPLTATNPVAIARAWVAEYVAAKVQRAFATAGGEDTQQGQTEIDAWRLRMKEIAQDASRFGAVLGQGTSASTITSYALSSGFASTCFDPQFTTQEKF